MGYHIMFQYMDTLKNVQIRLSKSVSSNLFFCSKNIKNPFLLLFKKVFNTLSFSIVTLLCNRTPPLISPNYNLIPIDTLSPSFPPCYSSPRFWYSDANYVDMPGAYRNSESVRWLSSILYKKQRNLFYTVNKTDTRRK